MDTKEIQIVTAENSPSGINVIHTPEAFLFKLDQNKITDLKTDRLQIKQDGNTYIFSIDGVNEFSIIGENMLKDFVHRFYERIKAADQNMAVDLNKLKLEVTFGQDERIDGINANLQEHAEQATNIDVINQRIDRLEEFFENQIDDTRFNTFWRPSGYTKAQREYRKTHKEEAKKRLKEIRKIKNKTNQIDRGLSEYADTDQYQRDIWLNGISEELDKISDEVPNFIATNIDIVTGNADSSPRYELQLNSSRQAKKMLKSFEKHNKELLKLTQKAQGVAQEQFRAEDLISLKDYLQKAANNQINPANIPWTPEHKAAFNYLLKLDSDLKNEFPGLTIEGVANQTDTTEGTDTRIEGDSVGNNNTENINGTNNGKVLDKDGNWVDSVGEGGLFGGVDNMTENRQDKSERGQNFYKSFGNVALLAGGIFLGIKAIGATWRIIRGKKKEGDRGRLGGTAGLLLLTAGRPQDLFKGGYASEKFADLLKMIGFGGGKEEQNNAPTQKIEQATTGAMTLFNGMKYSDMKENIVLENGKIKLNPEYRQAQLDAAKLLSTTASGLDKANAEAKVKFLETIGKDDKRGLIDLALISMGMNWDKLQDSANANEKFNDNAQSYIQRTLELAELMNSRNYQKTNSESDAKIQEYMQGRITLQQLEDAGVFETIPNIPPTIQDKFKSDLEKLDLTDEEKRQLLEHLYQFYHESPTKRNAADIGIEKNNDQISLKTYNEYTPLNLKDRTIPGLTESNGSAMKFPTTKELLRVANLTNRIKSLTRDLEAKKPEPFYLETGIEGVGSRITFNDKDRYKVWEGLDLRVISNDGLEKISQQLSSKESKEAYVDYLNNQKHRKGGSNNNETFVIPAVIPVMDDNLTPGNSEIEDDIEEDIDANIIDNDKLQKDLDQIDTLELSDVAKDKIKKDYAEFYKKYPSIKTIGVELIADGNNLNVKSYRKITPIDFNKNQVAGLNIDFGNFEDMFKTANLTNKIRSTFENIPSKSVIDPFHQDANLDIKFDDKAIWDWRPDVGAVSDGLWRGSLRNVSPKLAETSNKQLYIKYLNDLWLMQDKAEGFFPIIDQFSNFDTKQKIIDGFKSFYKNHPSEEKNIKFEKNEKETLLKTYEQSTPIDLVSKKIIGLSLQFDTYEELFKVANLINKTKDVTIDKEIDGDEAFDITYLGALEFYGTQKTIRVFSEDGLTQNSEKFKERSNKRLLEDYLNKRWRDSHGQTTSEIPQQ